MVDYGTQPSVRRSYPREPDSRFAPVTYAYQHSRILLPVSPTRRSQIRLCEYVDFATRKVQTTEPPRYRRNLTQGLYGYPFPVPTLVMIHIQPFTSRTLSQSSVRGARVPWKSRIKTMDRPRPTGILAYLPRVIDQRRPPRTHTDIRVPLPDKRGPMPTTTPALHVQYPQVHGTPQRSRAEQGQLPAQCVRPLRHSSRMNTRIARFPPATQSKWPFSGTQEAPCQLTRHQLQLPLHRDARTSRGR